METPSGSKMNMTPKEIKITRVGTLWFPLAMVVSMVIFVGMSAWIASREKTRIDNKFEALSDTVKNLSNSVEKIISKMGTPDGSAISKQEWLIECLQLQALNPGWKCPYAMQPLSLAPPAATQIPFNNWKTFAER